MSNVQHCPTMSIQDPMSILDPMTCLTGRRQEKAGGGKMKQEEAKGGKRWQEDNSKLKSDPDIQSWPNARDAIASKKYLSLEVPIKR